METIEENKVKFLLPTDWLFQEPIDFEHKKYVLLGYFKKIDEFIQQDKIYPTFIELSIHLASLQTLIKENVILSTDKVFTSFDDEVLLKELTAKQAPHLDQDSNLEIDKILKMSANKFSDYFNLMKSQWSTIYDSIEMTVRKNKKNINSEKGFFTYTQPKTNEITVWEYELSKLVPDINDVNIKFKLIYQGNKTVSLLSNILEKNSTFLSQEKKKLPVVEFKTKRFYPIDETLLPLFKRRFLSQIYQTQKYSVKSLV